MQYRVIKNAPYNWWLHYKTQCIRTIPTQLMIWRWPSQNTFGRWTVLYWTRSSRTQFGVSINVWKPAGDTFNITCNFLYCNHQVHRDFWSSCISNNVSLILTKPYAVRCIGKGQSDWFLTNFVFHLEFPQALRIRQPYICNVYWASLLLWLLSNGAKRSG
jgi:hypothetical protein